MGRKCENLTNYPLTILHNYAILMCMSDIRKVILKRMGELGLTIYQVSKLVEGKIPQRTVYSFLSKKQDTSTKVASKIMKAIGLNITVTKTSKRGKRSRKEKK